MSTLNTIDIPKSGGGVQKTLEPGNHIVTITKVELKPFTFIPGAYDLLFYVEGPDLGEEFQGFFLDKDNESLGRHKGQVARVKAGLWSFADSTTKSGVKINRDNEILKFLSSFCEAIDKKEWLPSQNGKHATIESLVEAFILDAPYKDLYINTCLAGKEYMNKQYVAHELFFPKFIKGSAPFELAGLEKSKVAVFNETIHIVKKKVESVANFTADDSISTPGAASDDFVL